MSIVHTEITLRNARDVYKAEDGIITEKDIRQTTVKALVDTGAWTLIINEDMCKALGLKMTGTETSSLADGTEAVYNLAGPLEVRWKDRRAVCEAMVLPNAGEVLLGAIPLEAMDLIVHPRKEEIVGAHGDQIIHSVK
jgi:clan AA aspartic protease